MFIRISESNKVISLVGKGLDIIRLPDPPDLGNRSFTMLFALVIVHNTADPPPPAAPAYQEPRSEDAYWKKFEVIAQCETHDAGEIRLGQPLEPLLDKICNAIDKGVQLLDWRKEKTYITFDDVLKMSDEAERKQRKQKAREFEKARHQQDFKVKI